MRVPKIEMVVQVRDLLEMEEVKVCETLYSQLYRKEVTCSGMNNCCKSLVKETKVLHYVI